MPSNVLRYYKFLTAQPMFNKVDAKAPKKMRDNSSTTKQEVGLSPWNYFQGFFCVYAGYYEATSSSSSQP